MVRNEKINKKVQSHLLLYDLIALLAIILVLEGYYEKYFVNATFTQQTELKIICGILILVTVIITTLLFKDFLLEK